MACGLIQQPSAKSTGLPPWEPKPESSTTAAKPGGSGPTAPPQSTTAPTSKAPENTPSTVIPENAPTAVGPQPNAYYEGISFYYDPTLAKGVTATTLGASSPAGEDMPFFAINPKEFTFDFQGYIVEPTQKPQIMVFSTKEYETLMSGGGDPNPVTRQLESLKKLMADHPVDSSGSLPFMPIWNAAQEMHAQLKYINFQNGSGIRYLTEYGQDVAPVSNKLLFYTFQGITSDGAYYISAILPINHPMLAVDEGEKLKEKDYPKFMENYPSYVVDSQKQLNAQKDDSFNPTLNMLDAMIASIKINK